MNCFQPQRWTSLPHSEVNGIYGESMASPMRQSLRILTAAAFFLALINGDVSLAQSATAFNTLRDGVANLNNDVYSFDPTGGTMVPYNPTSPPKNSFYINGFIAGTLPSNWVVVRYVTGDFAGDKLLDVAAQVGSNWYIGTRVLSAFQFNTSTPSGSTPGTANADFMVGNFHGVPYTGVGAAKEDIAYRFDVTNPIGGTWMIMPSTGTGGATGFSAPVNSGTTWSDPVQASWPQFQKLDVNFDGRDDIVRMFNTSTQMSTGTQIYVACATGTGFLNMNFTAPDARSNYMFGYTLTGVNAMSVGDFNRDGKSDLAAWNLYANNSTGPNKVWVGLSTGSLFDWDLAANVNEPGGGDMPWGTIDLQAPGNPGGQYVQVGDFNGDANAVRVNTRDDLLYFGAFAGAGREVKSLMSNGTDGFNRPINTTTANSGASYLIGTVSYGPLVALYQPQNTMMVGEISVDGRDDLWVGETNGTAFRIYSTVAAAPPGSGLASGFGLNRELSSYLNWSLYPTTYRIFGLVGRYWTN